MLSTSNKEYSWRRRLSTELRSSILRWISHFSRSEHVDGNCYFVISGKQWFRVVFLCFTVAIINSMDRMAMSIAILPMSIQHHWSDTDKGAVSRWEV